VPLIKVLVWAGLMNTLMFVSEPVFNAVGKPRFHTKWQLVTFIILAAAIYPLSVRWGMVGIAGSVFFANTVGAVGYFYDTQKILRCNFRELGRIFCYPLIGMFFCIILVSQMRSIIGIPNIFEFFLLVTIGVLAYLMVIYFFDKISRYKMGIILKDSVSLLMPGRN